MPVPAPGNRKGLGGPGGGGREEAEPVRVREQFPETLYWQPQLVTDDQGHARLTLDLADSITTWRLTASAVSADGRLGATQHGIKVFQPFFVNLKLPVALTRGDEVTVPVVVYNYSTQVQTVKLTLDKAAWFAPLEGLEKTVTVPAGEVLSTSYRLRAGKVGRQVLQVTARASGVEPDAVKRTVEVVPDGERIDLAFNGPVQGSVDVPLTVPADAVEGSPKAVLKLYPSGLSQVVEGLDAIFRMPYGCFEQTSSTTYPNVLALDYLKRTKKSVPSVEAKARQYIHLGYQRLLSFEVAGGGFDWFGRPPANRTLTAYGLLEFTDMAKVHDVDEKLIARTRAWLLKRLNSDGSWDAEGHAMHEDVLHGGNPQAQKLAATAYIGWAVYSSPAPPGGDVLTLQSGSGPSRVNSPAELTRRFLLQHQPGTISDPYVLALICNALVATGADALKVKPYLDRLDSLRKKSKDEKSVWWEQPAGARTQFYGAGRGGKVEATAMAVLALLPSGQYPGTVRSALAWLVGQKGPQGNWYSTQATVLALKALLAGSEAPLGDQKARRFAVLLDGKSVKEIVVEPDQSEVVQQIDLSGLLRPGEQTLTLKSSKPGGTSYQVAFRYHLKEAKRQPTKGPLSITVDYDRSDLAVNDLVRATATVANETQKVAPMVMLDLPIPPGFALETADLAQQKEVIAKYQVTARQAILYLRSLPARGQVKITYRLRATMPVKVRVSAARVYEYYDPDRQATSKPARLTVKGQ
jgi:hypothetical protein